MTIDAIILAAGQGTRMKSSLPKVLHPLMGRPILHYAIQAALTVAGKAPIVVIGHAAEQVQAAFDGQARFVLQSPQLGTGHAVLQAEPTLDPAAQLVLVTLGDMPLLTPQTMQRIIDLQRANDGPVTILTMLADDPRGFGRVVRDPTGRVEAIVEEAQCTPEQLAIRELNVSVYCFRRDWLSTALRHIPLSPKGEYYLTDVVGLARAQGLSVQAYCLEDVEEGMGINTRVHLAEATAILRRRINEAHMLAGVTMLDPATTYIEPGVIIGEDTTIWPNTYLRGHTVIGRGCAIGPNTIIEDCQVGNDVTLLATVMEQAIVEDHSEIGPFGHLRKGAHLMPGVHMGNFGEVKNSTLGPGVKMGHFSYIGDAEIGANVNIGCGTVTCNFDGVNKNKTVLGDDVFIGSDTMLVAPVTLGEGARTGAGAVVTKDVPPHSLAVGVPARVIRKLEPRD